MKCAIFSYAALYYILSFFIAVDAAANNQQCDRVFSKFTAPQFVTNGKQIHFTSSVLEELDADFHAFDRSNKEMIKEWNLTILNELRKLPVQPNQSHEFTALSKQQLQTLFDKVNNHPVAAFCNLTKYDPTHNIGFCFGRAMAAHIEALEIGLNKNSIKKVWAVGSLRDNFSVWQHHVATVVQGVDAEWYVIDPYLGKLVTIDDWYYKMKSEDILDDMQIFLSDAKRFGPTESSGYMHSTMQDPYYNNYFIDLLNQTSSTVKQDLFTP